MSIPPCLFVEMKTKNRSREPMNNPLKKRALARLCTRGLKRAFGDGLCRAVEEKRDNGQGRGWGFGGKQWD
jgi:hypothetical protein